MENNNMLEDRPEATKISKYFPDLQGENCGLTPGAGWFLPWIQNQLVGYLRDWNVPFCR